MLLAVHERRISGFFHDVIALVEADAPVTIDEMLALTPAHRRAAAVPAARLALLRTDGAQHPARKRDGVQAADGGAAERAGAGLERHSRRCSGGGVALLRRSYALILGLWQMSATAEGGAAHCAMPGRAHRRSSPGATPSNSTSRCALVAGNDRRGASPEISHEQRNADPDCRNGAAFCRGLREAGSRRGSVASRRAPQVVAGSGGETAVFAGEVKPRYESDLAFRIGGKIIERFVDAGARVRKGQVLARLDPADVGLQAEAAKGAGRGGAERIRFRQSRVRAGTRICSSRNSSARPRSTRSAMR